MKRISTAVVVLLLSSLSVAAQTVTGYCVRYDQRHWLYQKDGGVNVIDIDMEWPLAASHADIAPLQTLLASTALMSLGDSNYDDAVEHFLQRFGTPVTKQFDTLPDDSAFCYVKAKTMLLGYQPGRYIAMFAEYDCNPMPRSKQVETNRCVFVTYDIANGKLLELKDVINLKKLDDTYKGKHVFYLEEDGETNVIIVDGACLGQGSMYVSSLDGTCYKLGWPLIEPYVTPAAHRLMMKKAKKPANVVNYTLDNTFAGKHVFEKVDQPATFSSNGMDFKHYLTKYLQLPDEPAEHNVGNQMALSLVIDEIGQVVDVSVTAPCSPSIDREVVRVVKAMPRWKPAVVDGQNVCSRVNIPIEFK
ncbi:MAG: energy transducer TonB [Prevotella sp.]|nr:energy transducer TonB [Prevotella sp.]